MQVALDNVRPVVQLHHQGGILRWIRRTNHKDIAYLGPDFFSMSMLLVGGLMAP